MRLLHARSRADRPRRAPFKSLAVLALAAASLMAAPAAGAATAPPPPAGLTFGPHAPRIASPAILTHAPKSHTSLNFGATSTNWGGYAATPGPYTEVSSTWVEPGANCGATPNAMAAFWTGFDGYASASVEQTGSLVYCYNGAAYQYVWYEFYPAAPVYYNAPIAAGDVLTATVTSTTAGAFSLVLKDATQGWTATTTASNSSLTRSSAEVIAEAPSTSSGVEPLADFGSVTFTNSTVNNTTLGAWNPVNIEMVGASDVKAVSSALSGGTNFTTTWLNAS